MASEPLSVLWTCSYFYDLDSHTRRFRCQPADRHAEVHRKLGLRSNRASETIMLDSEPTLLGVLTQAWNYLFGNPLYRIDGIWRPPAEIS
jgi:hypothetical protein